MLAFGLNLALGLGVPVEVRVGVKVKFEQSCTFSAVTESASISLVITYYTPSTGPELILSNIAT